MSEILNNMREKLGKFIYMYMWLFILLFITAIVIYYRWEIRKEFTKSNKMEEMYKDIYKTKITSSINSSDQNFKYPLVDYYIKSSYNSCCAGNFYNSYVTLKALEVVINQGARLLDFQIYSINGEPVVGVSALPLSSLKGSYNYLNINDVFSIINDKAFTCSNGEDPLFLNFRIYSNKKEIYPKLASAIAEFFGNKLLSPAYGKEGISGEIYDGSLTTKNMCLEPLSIFKKKVIIMAHHETLNFKNPKNDFYQLVNLTDTSQGFSYKRFNKIKNTSDITSLKNTNKKVITCVMPDWSLLTDNYNTLINFNSGCQMNLMNYQNLDSNLRYYLNYFNNNSLQNGGPSAFRLKPANLRFVGISIKRPTPQRPCLRQDINPIELLPGVTIDKGYDCQAGLTVSDILFTNIGDAELKKKAIDSSFNSLFYPSTKLNWDLKLTLIENADHETNKDIFDNLVDIIKENDNALLLLTYVMEGGGEGGQRVIFLKKNGEGKIEGRSIGTSPYEIVQGLIGINIEPDVSNRPCISMKGDDTGKENLCYWVDKNEMPIRLNGNPVEKLEVFVSSDNPTLKTS
jgi:hypothetical protein